MMTRFYDNNFREEDLAILQRGDVIKYGDNGSSKYLIVNSVDRDTGIISGEVSVPRNSNVVTIERILDAGE